MRNIFEQFFSTLPALRFQHFFWLRPEQISIFLARMDVQIHVFVALSPLWSEATARLGLALRSCRVSSASAVQMDLVIHTWSSLGPQPPCN